MRKGETVNFSPDASYSSSRQFEILQRLFSQADIRFNGDRPWDPQIINPQVLKRALRNGTIGIGDGYMAGEWECQQLDVLVEKVASLRFDKALKGNLINKLNQGWEVFKVKARPDPYKVGRVHYDLGNFLFERMLDPQMVYSCGYWESAQTLEEAQRAKLKLVCEKLALKQGMHVLDIGGGWGALAKYMAENYGVSVVNVTVSKEQYEYANKTCSALPVENKLKKFQDITDEGIYDRVVSVGAFEHFRHRAYKEFMKVAHKALKEKGVLLLHTIGRDTSGVPKPDWITKHIFPESEIPNPSSVTRAYEDLFILEDWDNLGRHYAPTLMSWQKNFEEHWEEIKPTICGEPEQFKRMWDLYLLGSAGLFRAQALQLWQIVLSKKGLPSGYKRISTAKI